VSGDRVEAQGIASEAALGALVAAWIAPREVMISRPDLESVFLSLTGKGTSQE
jgi:hypothetical protein